MATLVPVEGDPFASASAPVDSVSAQAPEVSSGTLVPVDHDPFAGQPEEDIESRRARAQTQNEATIKSDNQQKPWYQNLGEGLGRGAERGTLGLLQAFNAVNPQDAADVAKQTRMAGQGTGIAGGIGEVLGDPRMDALLATGPAGWAGRAAMGAGIGWTDPTETSSPMGEGAKNALGDAAGFVALPPLISGGAAVLSHPMGALQKGAANIAGLDLSKLAAFKASQVNPTLGDVSNSPVIQRYQDILKNVPFASKTIAKGEEGVRSGIESGLAAAGYAPNLERVIGGDALKQGLNTYVSRGKDMFQKAYDGFDKKFALSAELTPATNTMGKIAEIKGRADTAEALDQYLSPAEQKLMANFEDAAKHNIVGQTPTLTYNDLKLFRTSIGKKLSDYTIGSSEKAALRELYGAMSQDMRQTVNGKGGKAAATTFDRLNSQYQKFQTNLDDNINSVINKPEVSQMLTAVRQGTALPDKTAAIMRALPSSQREIVRGSLIKEMGMNRTQAGGGNFDPVRFAGNFSKLDPAAQDSMMIGMDNATKTKFRAVLDAAKYAKETTLQGNPSGTAKNLTLAGVLYQGAPKMIGGAGHIYAIPALLATGNVTARMMTNPKFIDWLAKAPQQLASNPTRAIGMLGAVATAAHSDNAVADDLDAYHQELRDRFIDKQSGQPLKINISKDPNINAEGMPKVNLPTTDKTDVPPSFKQAEGVRNSVYKDKGGHRTVGIGFNLDNPTAPNIWKQAGMKKDFNAIRNGKAKLNDAEIHQLFRKSYDIADKDAHSLIPNMEKLGPNQKEAMVHLSFQYGKTRLKEVLPGVLAMANQGNGKAAAARLMASEYGKKFPRRAKALSRMLYANEPYSEG